MDDHPDLSKPIYADGPAMRFFKRVCCPLLLATLAFCIWLVKHDSGGGCRDDFRVGDLNSLASAIKLFSVQQGRCPTRKEGLMVMVEQPPAWPTGRQWTQLMGKVPKDRWGSDFDYTITPVDGGRSHVILRDRGPDGIPFNEDDQQLDCGDL